MLKILVFVMALGGSVRDADSKENKTDLLFSGTIRANYPAKNTTMKGVVIKLGEDERTYVCYDTDLLRFSVAWSGEFLKFGNYQREIVHPQPPEVAGAPIVGTRPGPGWAREGSFTDPREDHQGPLPRDWAKYRGLYRHGKSVVLSYTVGRTEILELPSIETVGEQKVINRLIRVGASSEALSLLVLEVAGAKPNLTRNGVVLEEGTNRIVAAVSGITDASWEMSEGKLVLKLPITPKPMALQLSLWKGPAEESDKMSESLHRKVEMLDLAALTRGSKGRWSDPVVTRGALATNAGPYVVDTLTEPVPNPWGTRTFFGGFDFFPDGRAAICTFHGDVWIVSGIDDKLSSLTWRRYASGLFQALGLKVVDGKIYVTGRDQITRLHDLNNDGEADFYENFNNDTVVTANYHEFSMDLHTDRAGNFYYAKGSPWPPNVNSPHQGTILQISKDGSTMSVFATGLRAPNGMAIGPTDEITVSDNQGHWMPASKLNLVKKGGFYGMVQAAHRDTAPTDFDKPICWLPMSQDNSSGGQVWTTSEKWGPLKNHMLFMSYGKGTVFHVMHETVDGVTQAGMVRMPFKLGTGVMRGRVNPKDGQVYLCGLRGWQTDGAQDGAFYRVRYTGGKAYLPVDIGVLPTGIKITFTAELDGAEATNVDNYSVEQWNYQWTKEYGSPDFSPSNPKLKKRDKVTVDGASLSEDKRSVLLQIADLKPVDQMRIRFKIKAADGTTMADEIHNTIHRVGAIAGTAANR